MLGNRSKDTRPELAVRHLLHAAGLRYRVDFRLAPPSRARADIVFTRRRIAVFIDGCFWHGCPTHGTSPRINAEYWIPKLRRNKERDLDTTALLNAEGWTVLRFWEHEDPLEIAAAITQKWRDRGLQSRYSEFAS